MLAVLVNLVIDSSVKASSKVVLPSSKSLYSMTLGCLTPSAFARAESLVAPKMYSSRRASAAAEKVVLEVLSSLSKKPTTTTLSAFLNSSSESEVSIETAGSCCLVMYEIMLDIR